MDISSDHFGFVCSFDSVIFISAFAFCQSDTVFKKGLSVYLGYDESFDLGNISRNSFITNRLRIDALKFARVSAQTLGKSGDTILINLSKLPIICTALTVMLDGKHVAPG